MESNTGTRRRPAPVLSTRGRSPRPLPQTPDGESASLEAPAGQQSSGPPNASTPVNGTSSSVVSPSSSSSSLATPAATSPNIIAVSAVAAFKFVPPASLPRSVDPNSNPISLNKGDRVSDVAEFPADGWVRVVKQDGSRGIVPKSYLKFVDASLPAGASSSGTVVGSAPKEEPGRATPSSAGRQGKAKYAFDKRPGTQEVCVKVGEKLVEIIDAEAPAYAVVTNESGERGLLPKDWITFTPAAPVEVYNNNSKSWSSAAVDIESERRRQEEEDERLARQLQAELDAEEEAKSPAGGPAQLTTKDKQLASDEELARMLESEDRRANLPRATSTAEVEKDRLFAEQLQRDLDVPKDESIDELKMYYADEAMARELQDQMQQEAEQEALQTVARENYARDPSSFPAPIAPAPNGCVSDGREIPGLVSKNAIPHEEAATVLSALQVAGADQHLADNKPTPMRKRNLALLDLLQSEHTFLQSLYLLMTNVFASFPTLIGADQELAEDAFVRSGICDVYLLHIALFRALLAEVSAELKSGTPARVGLQFVLLKSDFTVYSRYINHYHKLSGRLRQIGEWNAAFENELRGGKIGGVGGLAEMWFLPIQRVMRYGMVLGAILKTTNQLDAYLGTPDAPQPLPYTPPHPDIPALEAAIRQSVALSDTVNSIQARSEKRDGANKVCQMEGWEGRELGWTGVNVPNKEATSRDRLLEFEGDGVEDTLGTVKIWVMSDTIAIGVPSSPEWKLSKGPAKKDTVWRLWRGLDTMDVTLLDSASTPGKVRISFRDRTRGDARTSYPRSYKPRSTLGRPPEPPPKDEQRTYSFEMTNERFRRQLEEALKTVLGVAKMRTLPPVQTVLVKARAGNVDPKDYTNVPGLRSSDPFVVVRLVDRWPAGPPNGVPVAKAGTYRMNAAGTSWVLSATTPTDTQVEDLNERLILLGRSATVYKNLSPVFPDFSFVLPAGLSNAWLQIEVWDEDDDMKSDFIGSFRVKVGDLLGLAGSRTGSSWGLKNEAEAERRRKSDENVGI